MRVYTIVLGCNRYIIRIVFGIRGHDGWCSVQKRKWLTKPTLTDILPPIVFSSTLIMSLEANVTRSLSRTRKGFVVVSVSFDAVQALVSVLPLIRSKRRALYEQVDIPETSRGKRWPHVRRPTVLVRFESQSPRRRVVSHLTRRPPIVFTSLGLLCREESIVDVKFSRLRNQIPHRVCCWI